MSDRNKFGETYLDQFAARTAKAQAEREARDKYAHNERLAFMATQPQTIQCGLHPDFTLEINEERTEKATSENVGGDRAARLVKLIATCGPLDVDDPQPSITLMMVDED